MENSIEKDIHLLESYAGMTHKMTDNQGRPKLDQAIERILKDYKRALKENEELILDNLEYQRIQDISDKRTYRKKYLEERRKEEPNLLYPDVDEIYRRYYELRKENEELTISNKEIDKECSRLEKKEIELINENEHYKDLIYALKTYYDITEEDLEKCMKNDR